MTFLETVTVQVAVLSPAFAVMVADPSWTAVTRPLLLTVATAVLLEDQVTVLSVALSGLTVAESWKVSCSVSASEVLFSVTEVTGMIFLETVTVHVAVLSPALAVMVVVPSATAVTRPLSLTVAMAAFAVDQVTVLSVALSGLTVAVSW